MGTRSTITFGSDIESADACIYRHWDGYPSKVLGDLDAFFARVEHDAPSDTRFDDPSYLSVRFLVHERGGPALDFTGYGIVPVGSNCGEAYQYRVLCKNRTARPTVEWRKPGGDWRTGPELEDDDE